MQTKEIVIKELIQKYGVSIDSKTLSDVLCISYSQVTKILARYSKKEIGHNNILPVWKTVGKKRIWTITAVAKWLYDTTK